MKEELLHYIWRYQQYDNRDLLTTAGEDLQIVDPGQYNVDAGPDFLDGQVQVGPTRWHGHIEIHLQSSDWLKHGHAQDPAFQNVILHVVLREDVPIRLADNSRIPCLELQHRIDPAMLKTYRKLYVQPAKIPCQNLLPQVPLLTKQWWLDRMCTERLEARTLRIAARLGQNRGDWEKTFYETLAGGFGLRVNREPFEQLAERTPLSILLRHRQQLFQLEALLFGQAGLLQVAFEDAYPTSLREEYQFLQSKYQLRPVAGYPWKFSRMRPAGFPTIRLAQFAMLLHQSDHLFSKALVAETVADISHMLDVQVSGYWATHYRFDQLGKASAKRLGGQAVQQIVINVLVPFLIHYGKVRSREGVIARARTLLEDIPPEQNKIIRDWTRLGLSPEHSGDSQALLQLRKEYCQKHRCTECGIGRYLLGTR